MVVALRDVVFPSTYTAALPVLTLHNHALDQFDRAQDLMDNSDFMSFQVGLDAPATSSSSTCDVRMQGMRFLDFLASPQPWAGSSVSNEANTYHDPNDRTCASRNDHQENMDHSRASIPGQALEVKRSVVGSRGVTAATKARRKDRNQPGRFLCTLCGADITANHNLTSKVVRYWSLLQLIVPLQTT